MNDTIVTYPRIIPVGDAAFTIEFGNKISPELNRKVYALERAIEIAAIPAIIEMVPSYRSLLVLFDPWESEMATMESRISDLISAAIEKEDKPHSVVEIPVRYGGDDGPDLDFVADHNGLTTNQVIEIHASRRYPVYMMGFTPGFPYLGGMDPRIAAPRLETPRTVVPAGSVGIAGEQTGIYSIQSPGGWRLIGRTKLELFNPESDHPFLLAPGDLIRFVPLKGSRQ